MENSLKQPTKKGKMKTALPHITEQIYLVYDTNQWHSDEKLRAVCCSKQEAIAIIEQIAQREYHKSLSVDDKNNIDSISQTQGFDECCEFMILKTNYNTLIN